MEENLISKKDLLTLTGISYGQLYRWKRKKLIPEEWFVKKSSFTGQETFFPKEEILDRINKIKNMKDGLSLDEIADMFTPNLDEVFLTKDELEKKSIVSQMTISIYIDVYGDEKTFSFLKILCMYVVDFFIKSGEVGIEEGKNILITLINNYSEIKDKDYDVFLFRKFGAAICLLISSKGKVILEKSSKLVLRNSIVKSIEELKIKLNS
ncbi:YhbD family protein [Haloimpatiens sp. FM7315]|uniref:YhbD family protein n=1 Tax=Haloimpatiens sp. FM7315 TaxID=3298609 RepID=UPI00370ADDD9